MLNLKPEREPEPIEKAPQVPVLLQQLVQEPPTENVPVAPTAGKFGWTAAQETIKSLPFVTRDSECFVAKQICESEILKMSYLHPNAITSSEEYFKVFRMSSSEAMTYNEVNIQHCDKGLVGDYCFEPGDILFSLEDIKKYIKFLIAFKNAVKYEKMRNGVFGFLKINDENNTVPFAWRDGKQLMPTFYFDGADEFLKEKCTYITDRWICLYFKVCFILQKVRPELYNLNCLQVIDVMDVKSLFSPDTTFTLSWPADGYAYQNFVAVIEQNNPSPEAMLAAMHGMTEPPLSPLINQNLKANTPDLLARLESPQSPIKTRNLEENRPRIQAAQQSNMYNPSNFFMMPQQPSVTYQIPRYNPQIRSQPFVCTNPFCRECPFRPNAVANTYYPTPTSPVSSTTRQILPERNLHLPKTKSNRRRVNKSIEASNKVPFKKPREILPTEVPQHMPASSSTNRLSNVPYASPQSASSPEMQFPSPVISGAFVGSMSEEPQTLNEQVSRLASANTPLPQNVFVASAGYYSAGYYSAGYNNRSVAPVNMHAPPNVSVSSAGYFSGGYNNRTISASNTHLHQNLIETSARYNSVLLRNGSLAQSAGYYMPINNPVYLPGSVTSSRTTGASNGIDTLL